MSVLYKKLNRYVGIPWMAWAILVVMIALVVVGGFIALKQSDAFEVEERLDMTWAILKTEKLSFLTSQRQEWQADISSAKGAWYGIEESHGSIMADVYYGFDMSSLSQEDVAVEADGTVVIHFPSPQILTLSIRPETYDAVTKRTGLMKLKTMLDDGDDEAKARLQSLKREVLIDMLQKNQHFNYEELQEGIHDFLGPIFDKQGIPYRIEFPDDSPNKAILDYLKNNA